MTALAAPITDYEAFRGYRVSLNDARRLCAGAKLPPPASIRRIGRGEVSALFLMELQSGSPLVLKVFVRPPGRRQMEVGLQVAGQLTARVPRVPSPEWLHASEPDDVVPYPYAILAYVDGEDGDTLWPTLNQRDRVDVMRSCAEVLLAMHSAGLSVDGPQSAEDWLAEQSRALPDKCERLRQQGWMSRRLLDAVEGLASEWPASQAVAELSFAHYDFQLHNLRIDPASLEVRAVLDFDNATMAPAFTDTRDLTVSVLLDAPEARDAFWDVYGAPSEEQMTLLRLHCLVRVLGVLASYHGPTGFLSEATVEHLLADG